MTLRSRWRHLSNPGVCLGFVYAAIATSYLSDNSFLWQQRAGRLLLDGRVLWRDPFSWISLQRPLINHAWLANLVTAGLERLGGLGFVRGYAMVLAFVLGISIWKLISSKLRGIAAALLVLAASYPVWAYWSARPIQSANTGIVVLLVVLDSKLSRRWKASLVFVLMYVVGGMSPAWTFAACIMFIDVVAQYLELRIIEWWKVAATLLGVGALALNPWGIDLLRVPFDAAGQGDRLALLAEWKRPSLLNELGRFAYAWGAFTVLLLAANWRRIAIRDRMLALLGLYLVLSAYRGIELGVFLCLPAVASALSCLGWAREQVRSDRGIAGWRLLPGVGLLLVVLISAGTMPLRSPRYPDALLECTREIAVQHSGIKVISSTAIAGFLIYAVWPEATTFADDRTGHFPIDAYTDMSHLERGERVNVILKRWRPNLAFVERGDKWALAMRRLDGWVLLAEANNYELYGLTRFFGSPLPTCFEARKRGTST